MEPGSAKGPKVASCSFRRAAERMTNSSSNILCAQAGCFGEHGAGASCGSLRLADGDGRVFPARSEASARKLADAWSKVLNRMGNYRFKKRFDPISLTPHM